MVNLKRALKIPFCVYEIILKESSIINLGTEFWDKSRDFSSVQSLSHVWLFATPWTRPPCPSPTPGVHPNPCALRWWCHPTISSSVIPFSSCPQSFPVSGSFQMSQLFGPGSQSIGVSLVAQRCLPAMQETWVQSLGWEDALEKEIATHSTTLAWKIPRMEKPVGYNLWQATVYGRLESMVGYSLRGHRDSGMTGRLHSLQLQHQSFNEHPGLISFRMDWFDLLAVQGTQESSPTPQFKSINSSALSFVYSPTFTSIHDHWKNQSLD